MPKNMEKCTDYVSMLLLWLYLSKYSLQINLDVKNEFLVPKNIGTDPHIVVLQERKFAPTDPTVPALRQK